MAKAPQTEPTSPIMQAFRFHVAVKQARASIGPKCSRSGKCLLSWLAGRVRRRYPAMPDDEVKAVADEAFKTYRPGRLRRLNDESSRREE